MVVNGISAPIVIYPATGCHPFHFLNFFQHQYGRTIMHQYHILDLNVFQIIYLCPSVVAIKVIQEIIVENKGGKLEMFRILGVLPDLENHFSLV